MHIRQLPGGSPYASNCWLLTTDDGHAAVIDPSSSASVILHAVRESFPDCPDAKLDGILLTHGHFDHITAVDALRQAQPELQVYVHEGDAPMLTDGMRNASSLFLGNPDLYAPADRLLQEGDAIRIGNESLTVLHTPGHSPGSVCYLDERDGALFTGDLLFAFGVGRCDLWGGDMAAMRRSLSRLDTCPRTLRIYPGHGESAALGAALDHVRYDF